MKLLFQLILICHAISFARNGAKIIWADINLKTRTVDLKDVKKNKFKN